MHTTKDFARLIGMKGFSDEMLETHFKLYQGYVEACNGVLADVAALRSAKVVSTRAVAELQRRFCWELNGMRLHEFYFGNLGGNGTLEPASRLGRKLGDGFGSIAAWSEDFRGVAAMRGVGWAILYQDPDSGEFLNVWVNEHDVGHPAGMRPLLVLDLFEHAFLLDYGLRKDDYVDAFFANVDWKAVEARLT